MHHYLIRGSRYLFILALALLLNNALSAQISIKGNVTDNNQKPFSGVSVVVKESSNGTTTDLNGSFSISVPNKNAVLVFSFVGYPSQEIEVGNKTTISVSLSPSVGQLNEVVVVGYGTQKRKEVTSAVATVSAEQFNKGNISDVAQLLQGKVAGLSISRPGGNPNGGFTVRLRGLSTLGANTSPLIVVDGAGRC